MSKPIAPPLVVTPHVNPLANRQAVNPTTTTAQTDAQLPTTSTTESDPSEPTLTNKEAPKSPLDTANDSTTSVSSVMEHSAPVARDQTLGNSSSTTSTNAETQIKQKNSIDVLNEAALSGDVDAQFDLGMCYYEGEGVDIDHTQASIYFQLAAEKGDADAQYSLATLFLKGEGVEKNTSRALIWYQQAAQKNHPNAQYNLGVMYRLGDGVPKDEAKAVNYFRDSANLGHADAQVQLGLMYEKGQGVDCDKIKAFDWYLKAASQDNASAQFELGRMYADGTVIAKDDDKAMKLFTKAAKQGLHVAHLALSQFYANGPEKKKDLYLASYQLLKSGLQPDGKSINLYGFRSDNSDISNLVKLFPGVLVKFPEFKQVNSIVFNYSDISEEKFSAIGELIRSNTTLLSFILMGGYLKNEDARLLAQALENNTTLIELSYVSNLENKIDENINAEILKSLEQNRSIAKLRQYMLDHPIKRSDVLPVEVLEILVDKMIVSYLKSGHSLKDTVNAINEFLVSASINGIMMDWK
jgi:TPR repeat protein